MIGGAGVGVWVDGRMGMQVLVGDWECGVNVGAEGPGLRQSPSSDGWPERQPVQSARASGARAVGGKSRKEIARGPSPEEANSLERPMPTSPAT